MRNATLTAALCSATLGACALVTLSARTPPDSDEAIVHVLNRVAFGPTQADMQHVRAVGIAHYLDEQLHPERLSDSAMDARLAGLQTLHLSSREIAEQFEIPQLQARRAKKQAAEKDGNAAPPDKNVKNVENVQNVQNTQPTPEEQRRANQVVIELSEQKLLRAAYSERQLQEVLVDFWFNHFNVDARKGATRFLLTEYERDTIRPHVLGKFRDLLEATAKSPAMLFYLDNWMSADPNGPHPEAGGPAPRYGRFGQPRFGGRFPQPPEQVRAQGKNAPKGLNENYGRELMELHTLGVDGGYTQKDVTEVARALTGWTIQNPRLGGGYRFEARLHDPGSKVVLGHAIKAGGGEHDGEQVLDLLARHPATARFIATALVRRFVSDTPPPALVDRVADRFTQTDGDLREVTRTIVTSPEFLAPAAYGAKTKTPLEFVVSSIRATAASVEDATPLVREMRELGMPLYFCQPPTGYKDTADAWVNTGALVGRMNFALDLANDKVGRIVVRDRDALAEGGLTGLLGRDLSESTRSTIERAVSAPQKIALVLGSPEFQRR
jgi:uncharacterized protein (DUF1800 family)